MNRKHIVVGLMFAIFLLVPVCAYVLDNSSVLNLATYIVIYSLAAVSLDFIIGYGAMISFGHAAFFAIGGYVVGIVAFQMDGGGSIFGWAGSNSALIIWPLAMACAAVFGLFVGLLSLRTTGVQFIMITLAFAQMLYFTLVGLVQYGGDDGLPIQMRNTLFGLDLNDTTVFYYVCLSVVVIWVILCRRIINSPFGMIMRSFKQNARRSVSLGYAPIRYRLLAFVFASAGGGLAGALWANYALYVSPNMAGWLRSGEFMAMTIIGGVGSIYGAVIGVAVFLGLERILVTWTVNWMLFLGPILVLIVLFARKGVYGYLVGERNCD